MARKRLILGMGREIPLPRGLMSNLSGSNLRIGEGVRDGCGGGTVRGKRKRSGEGLRDYCDTPNLPRKLPRTRQERSKPLIGLSRLLFCQAMAIERMQNKVVDASHAAERLEKVLYPLEVTRP